MIIVRSCSATLIGLVTLIGHQKCQGILDMQEARSSLIHRPQPHHLVGASLAHPVFRSLYNGLSAGLFYTEAPTRLRGVIDDSPAVVRCTVILSGSCTVGMGAQHYHLNTRDVVTAYLPDTELDLETSPDFSSLEVHITPALLSEMKTAMPWANTAPQHEHIAFATCKANSSLHKAATSLCYTLQKNKANGPLCCAAALTILGHSLELMHHQDKQHALSVQEKTSLHEARQYLLKRIDKAPTILELAHYSGLSSTRLKTGFKVLYGCGPYSLFQAHRMEHAKTLLQNHTVTETAMQLGYSNMSHFSAAFQRQWGKAPHLYRKKQA